MTEGFSLGKERAYQSDFSFIDKKFHPKFIEHSGLDGWFLDFKSISSDQGSAFEC